MVEFFGENIPPHSPYSLEGTITENEAGLQSPLWVRWWEGGEAGINGSNCVWTFPPRNF